MAVRIREMLVNADKYRLKCPYQMAADSITVHNTANDAAAEREVAYMIGNNNSTSFHIAVDDQEAVIGIPLNRNAWHAGDGNGRGNRESISVEICYSKSGGERFEKAERNAAELVANMLKERDWGLDRVKKHQDWSAKYCPHRTLDLGWQRFLNMVAAFMQQDAPAPDPIPAPEPESVALEKKPEIIFTYAVRIEGGRVLPEVANLNDCAGISGQRITDVAIKCNIGSVRYRVHVLGGKWLPWVTGYDWSDHNNGYAGNGKAIDAIQVYYNTPSDYADKYGYHKATYRVSPLNRGGYYPWQYDIETGNGQDGFAGCFGNSIDLFQLC